MRAIPNAALKRLGLLTITVMLASGSQTTAAAQQYVDWMNQVNAAIRGDSLIKTGGCQGCEDAGAVSRQVIRDAGYAEFEVTDVDKFLLVGLADRGSMRHEEINYAFRFNGTGRADVMEDGRYQAGGDTTYRPGDRFRIEVVDNRVRYLKNGRLLRESQRRSRSPLALNASLGTIGATVQNARIETGDGRALSSSAPGRLDRFDNLDRNRDGIVTRREWRGSRRSFDDRDLNRNGRLAPNEFYAFEAGAVGTSGQVVSVNPKMRWTDTGIVVREGDVVAFEAEGTVQLSDDPNDVAGPAGARGGRMAARAPLGGVSAGSLIARIGNSPVHIVGQRRTFARAPASGRLFLGVNDDHLQDNIGGFRVTISIDRTGSDPAFR